MKQSRRKKSLLRFTDVDNHFFYAVVYGLTQLVYTQSVM